MATIWKFTLPMRDEFTIEMPRGARLLCVQTQGNQPCVWALVNEEAEMETRRFAMRGTGHDASGLTAEADYVGTFQLHGGTLVFHLFVRL